MKNAVKYIILAVFILCIILLVFMYINSNTQRLFLQKGVDDVFTYNFNALCTNLNIDTSEMNESQLDNYNNENCEYGHVITSFFSYTSYSQNDSLHSIVFTLDQMSGVFAEYETVSEPEMIEQLNYLGQHLDSEEISASVWKQLSVLLEERTNNN